MNRKYYILLGMLIAVAITVQGCFTMIKHPKIDYTEHSTEYYSNQCLGCHSDLEEYPYGFEHNSNPEFWSEYQNWGKYYTYPWWWESYWWDIDFGYYESGDNAYYPTPIIIVVPPNPWPIPIDPAGIDVGQGSGNTGNASKDKYKEPEEKTKVEKEKTETKPERRRMPTEEKK